MQSKAVVILATVGLGMYLWCSVWDKIIHERLREADMGDDERLAEVQHEKRQEVSFLQKVAVWLGLVVVSVGMWWVIIYGVARAIDMGRK